MLLGSFLSDESDRLVPWILECLATGNVDPDDEDGFLGVMYERLKYSVTLAEIY